MVPTDLKDLGCYEALDKAEHAAICPSLDLAEEPQVIVGEKRQLIELGYAVREKLFRKIKFSPPNNIFVNVPPNPF
jgi:hypothetical protein